MIFLTSLLPCFLCALCPLLSALCSLTDHLIRPLEHADWNCQTNLLCRLKVNDEFKLRCLLHRQISRLGTFQDLVHVNSRAPIEVIEVHPIGHETSLIDKPLLEINSWQPMLRGKLDHQLSFGEEAAIGGRHNRAHLLLLCGFKGALESFGVGLFSISSNFSFSATAAGLSAFSWSPAMPACRRSPTRVRFGVASSSISSLLVFSSGDKLESPVTLPPGRARLAVRPAATGSAAFVTTMGIVVVALLAANAGGVPVTTIRSTFRRTRSAA